MSMAAMPASSIGGHPAAPSEQCGGGGVSLEGEAGGGPGRTERCM